MSATDELLDLIAAALNARDLPAVEVLMRALAATDPHAAQCVLDVIECADAVRGATS